MRTVVHDFGTTARPRGIERKKQTCEPVPCLTILTHPSPSRIGDRFLLHEGRQEVLLSRTEPDFTAPDRLLGGPLNDPFISRSPLRLAVDGSGDLVLQRNDSRTEATLANQTLATFLHIPRASLEEGVLLTIADRVLLLFHLVLPGEKQGPQDHGILGFNDHIHVLRKEIMLVSDLKSPVLLRGPSGTGKELVAAAIHAGGSPKSPFVCVNMAAIPPNLAASELFGAVKGSFTGAGRDQIGFFRRAEGGTLFLDEVGETPLEVQVMLLRALETGDVSPVGAQRSIRVQTRLIAATDADLEALMELESFKKPLFHRLAGYEICLPPLRDRRDDLGRLFIHFAREVLTETGELARLKPGDPYADPWIPVLLMKQLLSYRWPGNVRQLRNLTRQILIGNRGEDQLTLPAKIARMFDQHPSAGSGAEVTRVKRKPSDWSLEEIVAVMRANRWDVKASASALGIARGSLYSLIRGSDQLQLAGDLSAARIVQSMQTNNGDIELMLDDLRVSERALRKRMKDLHLILDHQQ